jgi:glycosyltransferase involved in cell wall biosynthesis
VLRAVMKKNSERGAVLAILHSAQIQGAPKSAHDILIELSADREIIVMSQSPGPILDQLRERGIECHVIRFPMWMCDEGVGYWELTIRRFKCLVRLVIALVAITMALRGRKLDLVYTNTVVPPIGSIYAALRRVPHVWHIREPVQDYGWRFIFSQALCERVIFDLSEKVIFNSDYARGSYGPRSRANNCIVIHNGIDSEHPIDRPHSTGPSPDLCKVAVVGELIHRKGQDIVLDALNGFGSLPRFEVFFAGRGDSDYLEALAAKAALLPACEVHFLGVVNPWELLQKIDLLIVPSRSEAFGRVVVEGMLAGVPVLAAAVGGIPEIVKDGTTGFLFEPGSSLALRKRLLEVLAVQDLPVVAERAQQVARTQFSTSACIARVKKVLLSAAQSVR